jgi:hypothetical protein
MTYTSAAEEHKFTPERDSGGNDYENRNRNQNLSLSQAKWKHLSQHVTYYCLSLGLIKIKVYITWNPINYKKYNFYVFV